MKDMKHKILSAMMVLIFTTTAHAAEFCVENNTQLYLFLSIADSNNQDDHIRIATGVYPINVSPFIYDATGTQEANDLKISGGWTTFASNPCGQQLATSNFDTVLDGEDENLILSLQMVGGANLEVSNLFFTNGDGPGAQGGALLIDYPTGTQETVLIENNVFKSNSGSNETALSIDGANRVTVRNNSIIDNHATDVNVTRVVGIINGGSDGGIYFTNNTVLDNTNDSNTPRPSVYLHNSFSTSGVFVANNVFWDNQDFDIGLYGNSYYYFKNNDYQSIQTSVSEIDEFSGNFTLDPQFQPIGPINTHIPLITSPLVNAGIKNPTIVGIPPDFDETWYVGDKDILGNDRIIDGQIDIGAYEISVANDVIFENGFD